MKKISIFILMAASMLTACGDGNNTATEDADQMSTYGEGVDTDAMVIDRTAADAENEAMARAGYWTVDERNIEPTAESVRGNLDQMSQNMNQIESDIQKAEPATPEANEKMQEVEQQVNQAKQTLQEARQNYQANKFEEASAKLKEANETLVEARDKYLEVIGVTTVSIERENE